MRLLEDERGVTVQIGAILLFAILVILLSTYQAYVVPQENEAIEFQHSQQVESDLVAVRNSILSAAGSGSGRPESVGLGVQYPVRAFFVNPPPATGTLQTDTVGNATLSISNVTVTDDQETKEFFERQNGTLTYPAKSLVYNARYNVYDGAPSRILENGLLYNDFSDVHTVPSASNQVLVDGETITLVALNGSYSQNGVTASGIDPSVLSGPYNPVDVMNTSGNVTITFSSRMPASEWRNRTSLNPESQAHVVSVTQAGENEVRVVLEGGVEYSLRAAKIGVGSQTVDTEPAYITRVGSNPVRVSETATFEVRDEYNNPVSNADVTVSGGTVVGSATQSTNGDGRVTYEFSEIDSGVTASIRDDSDDADRVVFDVEESTGGGNGTGSAPYSIEWKPYEMESQPGVEYVNGTIVITPSEASSPIDAISRAVTPANNGVSGVFLDYSTENASVATFPSSSSGDDTNATGYSTVPMTYDTGDTTVYVSGLVGSDSLPVSVQRAENGVYYRYYHGDGSYSGGSNYMPDFESQTPEYTGRVDTFSIEPRDQENQFGFVYTAYIDVPQTGEYTFYTNSDDGSEVYVDGELVASYPGTHPASGPQTEGPIQLSEGRHNITVEYFESYNGQELTVSWSGPEIPGTQEIPSNVLTPRVPQTDGGEDNSGRQGSGSDPSTGGDLGDSFSFDSVQGNNNGRLSFTLTNEPGGGSSTFTRFSVETYGSADDISRIYYQGGKILTFDSVNGFANGEYQIGAAPKDLTQSATIGNNVGTGVNFRSFQLASGDTVNLDGVSRLENGELAEIKITLYTESGQTLELYFNTT
ncbi:PA14 domain-containing protein [Salarchaeum sp. III]|uniref:PA14 domain-containing protein n=1 Tax=Salarchaeum sp. III TaxID=3107927 RepID=UPI002ED9E44A